ncbi:MAG TPA: dienelactone hydrolase family protein [Acidimicrobiales bacterium]
MRRPRSIVAAVLAVGLVVAGLALGPAEAGAQTNPYQRGPNPTATALRGRGPYSLSRVDVSGFGQGYNNVTVCYPNDTSGGTFGGVVVMPGFLSLKAQMMWACDRLASHGFVVAVAETNFLLDLPGGRADQAQAIVRHLSGTGAPAAVRQRLDATRWAVTGWSMGGGGALETGVRNNPQLQAVVGFQPWDLFNFSAQKVPAMIVGVSDDVVAGVGSHSEPFYTQMNQVEKYYVEISSGGHFVGSSDNAIQGAFTIAWLKRWVDDDTRYDQFLCPTPATSGVTEIRNTCPMTGT